MQDQLEICPEMLDRIVGILVRVFTPQGWTVQQYSESPGPNDSPESYYLLFLHMTGASIRLNHDLPAHGDHAKDVRNTALCRAMGIAHLKVVNSVEFTLLSTGQRYRLPFGQLEVLREAFDSSNEWEYELPPLSPTMGGLLKEDTPGRPPVLTFSGLGLVTYLLSNGLTVQSK